MNRVIIVGNGESRLSLDLPDLKNHGTVIGCNRIYRDFQVDLICSVDTKMVEEVRGADLKGVPFCVRIRQPHSNLLFSDLERFPYKIKYKAKATGSTAIEVGCIVYKPQEVWMIGFDLKNSSGTMNNVYADSGPPYRDRNKGAVNPKNWIRTMIELFGQYKDVQFIRYIDRVNCFTPNEFMNIPNLKHKELTTLRLV